MSAFGSALLVTGPEALLAERAVTDAKAAALAEQPEAGVNAIQATDLENQMLSEVIGGSLFASHIVAVIEDLGSCPPDVVDHLVQVAANPPEDLCLILVHPGGNKGRGVVDKLKKAKVKTQVVAAPKPQDLARFVSDEAKRAKVRLGPQANQDLRDAVGTDLRALAAAVAQLAADAESGEIDSLLINRYFAGRAEVSAFKVANAVVAGNATAALETLRWALGTGVAPVLVVSSLARSFRLFGYFLDGRERRLSVDEIARRAKVPAWTLKSFDGPSRTWRQGDVAQAIRLIAEADAAVKGGAADAEYALEKVVLTVLRLRGGR